MKKSEKNKKLRGSERKEGVIFILHEELNLHLEKRIEPGTNLFGYTIIPGGGIEDGETDIQALMREVYEEYGVNVIDFNKLGIIKYPKKEEHYYHVFKVNKWNGVPSNPENINEHLVATFENARQICTHPLSQMILDLFEKNFYIKQPEVSKD